MMLIMATLSGTERLGLRTALSVAIYMPRMLKVVWGQGYKMEKEPTHGS